MSKKKSGRATVDHALEPKREMRIEEPAKKIEKPVNILVFAMPTIIHHKIFPDGRKVFKKGEKVSDPRIAQVIRDSCVTGSFRELQT